MDHMNALRHLRYTIFALLAVLCLLSMQQGAAFHGLSHLAPGDLSGQQKHLPNEKACDKCFVYAELGGGSPTTSPPGLEVPVHFAVIASSAYQPLPSVSTPVYSARAPPLSI